MGAAEQKDDSSLSMSEWRADLKNDFNTFRREQREDLYRFQQDVDGRFDKFTRNMDDKLGKCASKDDLKRVENEILAMRTDMRNAQRWAFGLAVAVASVVIGAMKYLIGH